MATEGSTPRRKLSAIVMVDVSGFSRMMGRDEEGTTARIREFHSRIRSVVEAHEGRVVDTAGDSVFGEFDSVVNAVRCAQAIQDTQATVNATLPPEEHIETRIGVHLGDVIVQDYQVYGDGVNIAARLQALADPGSICVSEAVYQQVFRKLDLTFEDLGVQGAQEHRVPNPPLPRDTSRRQTDRRTGPGASERRSDSGAGATDGANLLVDRRVPDAGRSHPARGGVVPAHRTPRTLPLPSTRHRSHCRRGSDRHRVWPYLGAADRSAWLFPHRARRRHRARSGVYAVERSAKLAACCRGFDHRHAWPKGAPYR